MIITPDITPFWISCKSSWVFLFCLGAEINFANNVKSNTEQRVKSEGSEESLATRLGKLNEHACLLH